MEDQQHQQPIDRETLEKRPGIFMIGSPNVGKRTLLSRLLSEDFEGFSDSSFEVHAKGWTIDTKYYTADVSVWMAHLQDVFALGSFPQFQQLAALVMVFDLSDISSLTSLKEWVSHTDIQKFEILICIGNKVDLLPGHPAHIQYRRRMLKLEDTIHRSDEEFMDYGISETEGTSLLVEEEPSWDVRRSCLEWCTERSIEYIEACASNVEFDRCLSVDGDSQGLDRLFGALSAHMWPGMILKTGNEILQPSLPERQDLSEEEESDFELEYEILSAGSAEPWDEPEEGWVSATSPAAPSSSGQSVTQSIQAKKSNQEDGGNSGVPSLASVDNTGETRDDSELGLKEEEQAGKGAQFELEEIEQLMSEIGNVRDSLRLMPDFQRREMAAKLAMRMANMFGGDSSDDEGGFK